MIQYQTPVLIWTYRLFVPRSIPWRNPDPYPASYKNMDPDQTYWRNQFRPQDQNILLKIAISGSSAHKKGYKATFNLKIRIVTQPQSEAFSILFYIFKYSVSNDIKQRTNRPCCMASRGRGLYLPCLAQKYFLPLLFTGLAY